MDEVEAQKQNESCIIIQSNIRRWLAQRRYRQIIINEFDSVFDDKSKPKLALVACKTIKKFLSVWKEDLDKSRFLKLCRYVTRSLEEENPSHSYIGVFLHKEFSLIWIQQVKEILYRCNVYLNAYCSKTNLVELDDTNSLIILLHTMVSLTSTNTWCIMNAAKNNLVSLKSSFQNLCRNTVGFLVQQNLYLTLKKILLKYMVPLYQTKRTKLSHASLTAVIVLACRPLIYSNFSHTITVKFVCHFLSIPAIISHAREKSPEFLMMFNEDQLPFHLMRFLKNSLNINGEICSDNSMDELKIAFNLQKNNNLLCVIANFIDLANVYLECPGKNHLNTSELIETLTLLLSECSKCVNSSRTSNLTQWHPILGWFPQDNYDSFSHESLPAIKNQLAFLWSKTFLNVLLEEPLKHILNDSIADESTNKSGRKNSIKKKALDLLPDILFNANWRSRDTKLSVETQTRVEKEKQLEKTCKFYHLMVATFVQLRLDILTGLCYQGDLIYSLWKYLSHASVVKLLYKLASNVGSSSDKMIADQSHVLLLFAECMTHFITILDDVEMYEVQELFSIQDYIQLSTFLNNFLCKGIMSELFIENSNDEMNNTLFSHCHALLNILYLRDCRRTYVLSKSHWVIKNIKTNTFFNDSENHEKKFAFLRNKMPHVIPYSDRVHMFKKALFQEKCNLRQALRQQYDGNYELSLSSNPPIAVRSFKMQRNTIVEDAYHLLHKLDSVDMKQAFRIKFINAEGLEEAGIDQAGIFKEFIVELTQKLFDSQYNLFKRTPQGHVYPSPVTSMSERNHLDLVEFSGKMLAKAVYEGIVLDVRLASFFLNQILGQTQSTNYSYVDDLPSMDEELYRSLMYIKHYEGDVSDLALTFSTTEEVFGSVLTRELVPGGRAINVTKQNKIIYIHMMAHFRMHTQIKQQTAAFARGFHSLFTKEVLSLFSVPEWQLLISGEDQPLDFTQLRQHTQYYGGFHDSHKVIVWLWDILINDFSENERSLFLKFITSSSKPPVLGFAFLNPPFSIRCVEVSEDEDYGDSVGSVIRGFFTIRKREPEHRLPSSSTCFNLLKLPNYSRKQILRDKLRYAITANSGFELS